MDKEPKSEVAIAVECPNNRNKHKQFYTIISLTTILTTTCIVAISIYLAFEIIRAALRRNRVIHATTPIYSMSEGQGINEEDTNHFCKTFLKNIEL